MKTKLTERMIENRISKIRELEEQMKLLKEETESLKKELKDEMKLREVEELETKNHKLKLTTYVQNRIDTSRLKTEQDAIYKAYLKGYSVEKFTIA